MKMQSYHIFPFCINNFALNDFIKENDVKFELIEQMTISRHLMVNVNFIWKFEATFYISQSEIVV